MKVKLISRMAGPGGNHAPGSVIDVDPVTAKALIDGSHAVSLEPELDPVVVPEPEVAASDETAGPEPVKEAKKPKRKRNKSNK